MLGRFYEIADRLRHWARRRRLTPAQALGRRGEDIAHRFLRRQGMIVVARNYRGRSNSGEIDLIAWDRGTLVFVEVKSRETDEFGSPDRAVGSEKLSHLERVAREFARQTESSWENIRFDIVTVVFKRPPRITHLVDVYRQAHQSSTYRLQLA